MAIPAKPDQNFRAWGLLSTAMHRVLALTALVGALLVAGGASPADAATPPRASLDHFSCRTGSDPRYRRISVRAVMRAQPHPSRMALRFELLFRAPGANYSSSLQGGDLGHWRHPTDPSTLGQRPYDVWRVTKAVSNLGY